MSLSAGSGRYQSEDVHGKSVLCQWLTAWRKKTWWPVSIWSTQIPYKATRCGGDGRAATFGFGRRLVRKIARWAAGVLWPRSGITMTVLTYRLRKGYGVDVVVSEQLEYFRHRGYSIRVVLFEQDAYYEELRRKGQRLKFFQIGSLGEALSRVKKLRSDVVIAHTPPFFALLPQLPEATLRVFYDYGEPPSELFQDAVERQRIREEKIRCAQQSDVVFSISDFIARDSGIPGTVVNWLGNDHLLKGRGDLLELGGEFRRKHGLENLFLVLNVTRYFEAERRYKGVEFFAEVRRAFAERYSDVTDVRFVLVGRSLPVDREWAATQGLSAFSDFSEAELTEAYLDADAYLSGSQWEGYNLGIGQAISFGLFTVASDRGAHREFGIPVSNDPATLAEHIYRAYCDATASSGTAEGSWVGRRMKSRVHPWKDNLVSLEKTILENLHHKARQGRPNPTRLRRIEEKLHENARLRQVRECEQAPDLSILILNRDKPELLAACVDSIEQHCDVPYEILLADTGSQQDKMMRYYANSPHQVLFTGFYNFSVCNNMLAERARGEYLLLLNNDTELLEVDFRKVLDCFREHSDIGAIGGNLLYPDGSIQHAGIRICTESPYRGIPEHVDRNKPFAGYAGAAKLRTCVAVTGACLMARRRVYIDELCGLDPLYQEEGQDVDFCLRLRARGLRSVVHPNLVAVHHESASRTVRESEHDRAILTSRYRHLFESEIYKWQQDQFL